MLIGVGIVGISLLRWEIKDIKETRLAAKSPIGLPVMIEAVGRAPATLQAYTHKLFIDTDMHSPPHHPPRL